MSSPPDALGDLFPVLEPPPGGLARLHQRIAVPQAPWRPAATFVVLAAAAALVGIWRTPVPRTISATDDPVLVALTATVAVNDVLTVTAPTRLAAQRVSTPNVLYYRVNGVAARP